MTTTGRPEYLLQAGLTQLDAWGTTTMESQLVDTVGMYLLLARINEDHIKDPVEQYEVPCIAKGIDG